ncbi:leucine dehydrogenase [Kytococcus schroeteri]|uniref:Leucine dehydrogenase n=2 Tax=Kytococcus schroeteri TaxID=138300 RepID=A0A2I1PAC6_9MICO|nr:leucine dehydrogenase [Kytococcus schroeteri]
MGRGEAGKGLGMIELMRREEHGAYTVSTYRFTEQHTVSVAHETRASAQLPGNGGTRWLQYPSTEAAAAEALVLAQCMTRKHSLYETGFCGTKLVIDGPLDLADRSLVHDALAEVLRQHDGALYTGCDLNTTSADMREVAARYPAVLDSLTNPAVCTSTATGSGVFAALTSTLLPGERPRIAVHGLGKVGGQVARLARNAGYDVAGFDVRPEAAEALGVRAVDSDELFTGGYDVVVLCSLSGIVTEEVAATMNPRWVVASANAPFATPEAQRTAEERGIHYLPDYVANSGAVLCDALEWRDRELYDALDQAAVDQYVMRTISSRSLQVLAESGLRGVTPEVVAAQAWAEHSPVPA